MPYLSGRTYYDADSHLMELNGWLPKYADPAIREKIRPLYLGAAGALAEQSMKDAKARKNDPEAARKLEANLMNAKGWSALGAFDPSERVRALDLIGVQKQLVFSTFAPTQFASDDLDLLYGGTRAHNRAMADFCSADKRMIAVGFVPLANAERALAEAREAIRLGCGAVLVPSAPPKDKSPTHPDFHPLWALLQETGVPFVTHVGGGGRSLRSAFHNNGKPRTSDFLGGGENIRSKDYMSLHFAPEIFVACMVLDGIFEQFPRLRGGCIEQGAMWVIPLLRRIDLAQDSFSKTEPALKLPLRASDYIRRQLKFTPFPSEPTGWLIEQGGEELFMFSTDYPHPEGTRDPLNRFEATLGNVNESARDRFYSRNFAEMMGLPA